jgi:hypothetical protein
MSPRKPVSAAVVTPSSAVEHTPTPSPRKGRGGAPGGERNGNFVHGLYSHVQAAYRTRTKLWTECQREALQIVTEAGIDVDMIGRRLARRLAETEFDIAKLHQHNTRRGSLDKRGVPKPAFERELQLKREDRVELRGLVDKLAEIRLTSISAAAGETVYTVRLHSGAELEEASAGQEIPS